MDVDAWDAWYSASANATCSLPLHLGWLLHECFLACQMNRTYQPSIFGWSARILSPFMCVYTYIHTYTYTHIIVMYVRHFSLFLKLDVHTQMIGGWFQTLEFPVPFGMMIPHWLPCFRCVYQVYLSEPEWHTYITYMAHGDIIYLVSNWVMHTIIPFYKLR